MFIVFVIGLGRIKNQQTVYFTAQISGNQFQYYIWYFTYIINPYLGSLPFTQRYDEYYLFNSIVFDK